MKIMIKLAFAVSLFLNAMLFAQDSWLLKGKVSGADSQPVSGVSVSVQNTSKKTMTNSEGNYQIQVKKGDVLNFSSSVYKTKIVIVSNQKALDISLEEQVKTIDEVVVVGYGTQKKSHLTGSISKVTNENLDQIAVSRVDDALVGKVSGVNIQATEGNAGSAPTIRIRGTGSLAGSSSPLIVVDGLAVDEDFLGSLDMNDVESFEVLKDAASSAIYGSRGANGVIMITTKKGKKGNTKFSYNTYTGYKEARKSKAYYITVKDALAKELAETGTLSDRSRYIQLLGMDNNWQNIIFNGGTITDHAFSARGGNDRTKFSASLGYNHDEGVLIIDDYKKYSARLNLETKLNDKLTFGLNLSPSYTNRVRFDGSPHDILRQAPWLPLYLDAHSIQFVNRLRESGRWAYAQIGDYAQQRMFDNFDLNTMTPVASGGTSISDTSNQNPGAKVLERDRRDLSLKIFGNAYAQYNIGKGLSFRASLGGDIQNTNNKRFIGANSNNIGASTTSLTLADENAIHVVTEEYFAYDKAFGNHDVSAVAGFAAEKWDTSYKSITGSGYENEYIITLSAATIISDKASIDYQRRLMSVFGRLNYAYNNKYLVSLNYRRDGGSVFGSDTKYGNFPAASAGWVVSKENFMSSIDFISNLKLRASYGITGNLNLNTGSDLIDNYPYMALLTASSYVVNNGQVTGYNPVNIANPYLQWERSIELNPGIDFGFFHNRISGSFEYYKRNSDQLLLNNPISSTTGFTNALVNLGEVENRGYELELRTRNITGQKFKWSTTIIASTNKNTLISFGDSNGQIQNVDDKRAAEWINLVGNPISSFYGWVVDREIPKEYIVNPYFPLGGQAKDVYVKDLNGDGVIDDDDKTILGSPYPKLVWSFTNEFEIGNFDFSFMFQGSHGAQVRNMADQYIFNHFNSSQSYNAATTPDQGFIREKIFTNSIIQDASYITLRTASIGYNFSKETARKFGMTKARLYATGQNILYFTADDYTGWNPESIDNTSPTTYGYQLGGFPIFRTVSLGMNVEF
ncbi:MAG: TonB-dependent receptor [Bergeyella sp.]